MNNDEKIKRIKDALIILTIINEWIRCTTFDTFIKMELYRKYLSYIYAITIDANDEQTEKMKNDIDEWIKSLEKIKYENKTNN